MADTTNIIYWGVSDGEKKELSDVITTAVKKNKPLSEFTREDWETAFDKEMNAIKQYNGTSENYLGNRTKKLVDLLDKNKTVSILDKNGNAIPVRKTPTGWYVLHGKVEGNKSLTKTVFEYLKSEFFRTYSRRMRSTDTIVYTDYSFTMFCPVTKNYEEFTERITETLKEALNAFGYRTYGGPMDEVTLEGEYVSGTQLKEIRKIVVRTERMQVLHEARITAERAA